MTQWVTFVYIFMLHVPMTSEPLGLVGVVLARNYWMTNLTGGRGAAISCWPMSRSLSWSATNRHRLGTAISVRTAHWHCIPHPNAFHPNMARAKGDLK
ncbi:hypothetical protein J6590_093427 [Homalodisca vitripennis]|nr:hypothetical protein J6590_089769 [Homalodisca vitripennis]KAG8294861.1 hypothetical protein J6590_093427 [Homalodisca vitripennis]